MRTTRRCSAVCVAATVLAVLAAGCGTKSISQDQPGAGTASPSTAATASSTPSPTEAPVPSADELCANVDLAVRSAKTVRMTMTTPASVGLTLVTEGRLDGSNQRVTVRNEDGRRARILTVKGKVLVKANSAYWTGLVANITPALAEQLASSWVTFRRAAPEAVVYLPVEDYLPDWESVSTWADVTEDTVDGQSVFVISEWGDSSSTDEGLRIVVDARTWLPRTLQLTDEDGTSVLVFSRWGSVKPFSKPPASFIATVDVG